MAKRPVDLQAQFLRHGGALFDERKVELAIALGQTVKCSRSAGLPVNGSGSGIVRVNIARGVVSRQGGDPLVIASIATAAADTANPDILLDCASTPDAAHCEHHAIPVSGRCMDYAEDIYCDGYESVQ